MIDCPLRTERSAKVRGVEPATTGISGRPCRCGMSGLEWPPLNMPYPGWETGHRVRLGTLGNRHGPHSYGRQEQPTRLPGTPMKSVPTEPVSQVVRSLRRCHARGQSASDLPPFDRDAVSAG